MSLVVGAFAGFNADPCQADSCPQDYAEAAKWYRKAAEQGHGTAQLNLGNLLAEGRGVEQDLTEAYKWTALACRGGPGLFGLFVKDAAYQDLGRLRVLMTPDQIAQPQKLLKLPLQQDDGPTGTAGTIGV